MWCVPLFQMLCETCPQQFAESDTLPPCRPKPALGTENPSKLSHEKPNNSKVTTFAWWTFNGNKWWDPVYIKLNCCRVPKQILKQWLKQPSNIANRFYMFRPSSNFHNTWTRKLPTRQRSNFVCCSWLNKNKLTNFVHQQQHSKQMVDSQRFSLCTLQQHCLGVYQFFAKQCFIGWVYACLRE